MMNVIKISEPKNTFIIDFNDIQSCIVLASILPYFRRESVVVVSLNTNDDSFIKIKDISNASKNKNIIFVSDKGGEEKSLKFSTSLEVEKSFVGDIYCLCNLSLLSPYLSILKKFNIYYFSSNYFLDKKPISSVKYVEKEAENDLSIVEKIKNIVIFPINISLQLTKFNKNFTEALNELLDNSFEKNDFKKLYLYKILNEPLGKFASTIYLFFKDLIDIKKINIIQNNNAYISSESGVKVKMATHIHKIETLVKFIFEMYYETKHINNDLLKINLNNRYEIFKPTFLQTNDIYVDEFGWEKKLPSLKYVCSGRDNYLLHFVKSGNGELFIGGKKYKFKPREAFLIEPHKQCIYGASKNDPCYYYWISFNGKEAKKAVQNSIFYENGKYNPIVKLDNINIFIDAIHSLTNLSLSSISLNMYIVSKISFILSMLSSNFKKEKNDIVNEAKKYIETNFCSPIKVNDICYFLNYDRSTLCKKFKARTGFAIKDYMNRLRLEKAEKLLSLNQYSLLVISQKCGFDSLQNFNNNFKNYYNITPKEYIKKAHKII